MRPQLAQPATPTTTWFETDLFYWNLGSQVVPSWAWQAGASGHKALVRGRHLEPNRLLYTFDTNLNGTIDCKATASSWSDFDNKCVSDQAPEVTIYTSDYVPLVGPAATFCSYDYDFACSPCVSNSLSRLSTASISLSSPDLEFEVVTGSAPSGTAGTPHVQGISRLSDMVGSDGSRTGRVVITDNLWAEGMIYAEQPVQAPSGAHLDTIFEASIDPVEVHEIPIREEQNHPSGSQAHGNLLVVAMEDSSNPPDPPHAWVDFWAFPQVVGAYPNLINRLVLDGSRGEPLQSAQNREPSCCWLRSVGVAEVPACGIWRRPRHPRHLVLR